jgi:hypothetical protein
VVRQRERRPGHGAVPNTHVAIDSSNTRNIPDPGTGPQPSDLRSIWPENSGLVRCIILRRSERRRWLAALAAHDGMAIEFTSMIGDWILRVPERRPVCLSCEVVFSSISLPTVLVVALGLQSGHTTLPAMISGVCAQCGRKSDRELLDAALDDLRATFPNIRTIELVSEVRRA